MDRASGCHVNNLPGTLRLALVSGGRFTHVIRDILFSDLKSWLKCGEIWEYFIDILFSDLKSWLKCGEIWEYFIDVYI
jgi:hypothetical protein